MGYNNDMRQTINIFQTVCLLYKLTHPKFKYLNFFFFSNLKSSTGKTRTHWRMDYFLLSFTLNYFPYSLRLVQIEGIRTTHFELDENDKSLIKVETVMRKQKNAGYQHFHLFRQCILKPLS